MTQQQWDKHADHMSDHVSWPANKKQILEACNGEDVEKEVILDIAINLPEGTYQKLDEIKKILVK